MKVLLEMRPALDGYSGIPQETRLLFRGLARLPDVQVCGLIQSGNLPLEMGLPVDGDGRTLPMPAGEAAARLSATVVSMQQGPAAHRLANLRRRLLAVAGPLGAALAGALGVSTRLTRFDADRYKDFVWRAMFAKTLQAGDFDLVTKADYRVLRWPWSMANAAGVVTGTLGHALYPLLDTQGFDVLLVETPYPGRPKPGTRMVVRYHDAIPLTMTHTVKDRGYHRAMHLHALRSNARAGAWFACVSDATRQDLLSFMPEVEARCVTIPNMIAPSFVAETEGPSRVPEIIWSRRNKAAAGGGGAEISPVADPAKPLRYLLMVSTIEPRKNHLGLLEAWELLRHAGHPDLQLVCVGGLGWDHEAIMARYAPWLHRGGVHLLQGVPAEDLRLLYRHAQATVCPSFGEGFDFSGVEAMRSGGAVVASDIPVHREVFADAAEYHDTYSSRAMAEAIARVIDAPQVAHREALVAAGHAVAARYTPEVVMPLWRDLLSRLAA